MKHVFISLMLFVNYEIMLCNVFKLLNVIIGLVIMFGSFFIQLTGLQCACKITYGSVSVSMPSVYQAKSRLIDLIDRFIGFEPFQIKKIGRFRLVSTGLSRYTGYRWAPDFTIQSVW